MLTEVVYQRRDAYRAARALIWLQAHAHLSGASYRICIGSKRKHTVLVTDLPRSLVDRLPATLRYGAIIRPKERE